MSSIHGKYIFSDDWINKVHPQNGLFKVYWKGVVGPHNGGVTLEESEGEGLRWEFNYKDGKRHRLSQGWWPSGNLKSKWNWKDGKLDGVFQMWHDNTNMRYYKNYENGILQGKWLNYYENGQIACKKFYKDGEVEKKPTHWDKNGDVL